MWPMGMHANCKGKWDGEDLMLIEHELNITLIKYPEPLILVSQSLMVLLSIFVIQSNGSQRQITVGANSWG